MKDPKGYGRLSMAWIRFVEVDEAEGKLKEYYDHTRRARGKIANIIKVQSLNPEAMKAHMDLYLTTMFGRSNLTRVQREMIATVVSATNDCGYCTRHHGVALRSLTKNEDLVEQMTRDFDAVDLSEKDHAMLRYAVKLTKNPHAMRKGDVEGLRKVGFKDVDILNINLIASYFNFVNRIALGLGVEFSDEEAEGYKY